MAIATLNRPDGLADCLDALLVGEILPAEVIVVDQSRDRRTQAVLDARSPAAVPIVRVRQSRIGLSASRNAAMERAAHALVAFTDDDCVPDSGWVRAIERAFALPTSPDAITGRVLPFGPPEAGMFAVSLREAASPVEFQGRHIPWLLGTGGNFAVRREWLARVGKYDERLGAGSPGRAAEDADLFYRLLRLGARFRYEPQAIVYHRRQGRSQRLSSRWAYGHGIGAFCGIRLRQADPDAFRILVFWLLSTGRELASAVGRREWLEAHQRVLGLRGAARGLVYGLCTTELSQDGHP